MQLLGLGFVLGLGLVKVVARGFEFALKLDLDKVSILVPLQSARGTS